MRKILIVEDDNDIAMLERDYLEIAGFSTGLAAALSGEYDLILLDVMLPGRDGYDICRQLRDKIDVPISPGAGRCTRESGSCACPTGSLSC